MKFRQYLLENENESTRHMSLGRTVRFRSLRDNFEYHIFPNTVYYINKYNELHRLDGPAEETKKIYGTMKIWWINGGMLMPRKTSDSTKWLLLKANIENNLEFLNDSGMTEEMQKYICTNRPDLIGKIDNLDPELKKKYPDELELSKVDI